MAAIGLWTPPDQIMNINHLSFYIEEFLPSVTIAQTLWTSYSKLDTKDDITCGSINLIFSPTFSSLMPKLNKKKMFLCVYILYKYIYISWLLVMFCLILRVLPRPPCSLTESYPDIVCLGWRKGLVCVKRESNVLSISSFNDWGCCLPQIHQWKQRSKC